MTTGDEGIEQGDEMHMGHIETGIRMPFGF